MSRSRLFLNPLSASSPPASLVFHVTTMSLGTLHQPVTGFRSFQMLMELKGPHVIPGYQLNLFLDEIPGLTCMTVCLFLSVTKELVSWMRGHESSVFSISVHGSGRYAITTSSDTAQLWDLDTFQRKRKLNILQSVGIQKVSGRSASWPVVLLRLVSGSAGYGCYKSCFTLPQLCQQQAKLFYYL